MSDLPAAIAAARKAYKHLLLEPMLSEAVEFAESALRDLLAALDAARGQAVAWSRDEYIYDDEGRPIGTDEVQVLWRVTPDPDDGWQPLYAAPTDSPRVERYGDGVLVHWPEGMEQYVAVGDCVTGNIAPPAEADADEDAYVIERMGKLLAEIAIIVNGTEPHDTLWSYHDLPEKVRALKQAPPAAAVALPAPLPPAPDTMNLTDAQREVENAFRRGWNSCRATVMQAPPAVAVSAEPVAWQYEFNGQWILCENDALAKSKGWPLRPVFAAPPAAADADEDAYVIERMGKLLAEIAIIVNGTEPHDTLWSYHDLPEKVRALKQAPPAAAVPPGYALVPAEPTPEMIAAGWFGGEMHIALGHANAYRECEGDYARLLAAAERKEE